MHSLRSTILAVVSFFAATMDLAGSETPITDPAVRLVETLSYLPGSTQVATRTVGGETTSYVYDYRQRVVATTVTPNTGAALTTTRTYVANKLNCVEDPYGRKTFVGYVGADLLLGRMLQTTVPDEAYPGTADVISVSQQARSTSTAQACDVQFSFAVRRAFALRNGDPGAGTDHPH